jgi:hypothetical protein
MMEERAIDGVPEQEYVVGFGVGSDLTSSGVSLDAWGNVIEDSRDEPQYAAGDQHPAAVGAANDPATGDVNTGTVREVHPQGGASALDPATGRPREDDDEDDADYEVWTVADLDAELRERGLSAAGNKAEKVARLEAHDAAE